MTSVGLEDGDIRVGIDADLGGDLECFSHDVARGKIRILEERAGRCERVGAARSDREDAIVGLDDVARSRDDETMLPIGYREQSVKAPQHAIAPPVLRQLHRCTLQISGIALELFLELLEKRERVRRRAREPGEQLATVQRTHLLRVRLHHGLSNGDLSVASECDLTVAAHRKDGSRPHALELHRFKITAWGALGASPSNAPPSCTPTRHEAGTATNTPGPANGHRRPHDPSRRVAGGRRVSVARASPAYPDRPAQGGAIARRAGHVLHGSSPDRTGYLAVGDDLGARGHPAGLDRRDHEPRVPEGDPAISWRGQAGRRREEFAVKPDSSEGYTDSIVVRVNRNPRLRSPKRHRTTRSRDQTSTRRSSSA